MSDNTDINLFRQGDEVSPRDHVSARILNSVKLDLNPTWTNSLPKILLLQIISGIFVLMFCPQFGVGLFGGHTGLTAIFMRFGATACAALCGAIFVSVSLIISILFLSRPELRLIKRSGVVCISIQVLAAFFAFLVIGKVMAVQNHFAGWSYELVWMISALITGVLVLKLGVTLRLNKS